MLPHEIVPKQNSVYATYIQSRNGQDLKHHKTLGSAKGALVYHHWNRHTYNVQYSQRQRYLPGNLDYYTNGLYRWENGRWVLIFVAHPELTKEEVQSLLRYIK